MECYGFASLALSGTALYQFAIVILLDASDAAESPNLIFMDQRNGLSFLIEKHEADVHVFKEFLANCS